MAKLEHTFSRIAERFRALRVRPSSQEGFALVEVLVSAIMITLIAGGVFAGLEASGRATSDLRDRSRAAELAQQDQERLRGLSAVQLQNLNQTRTVTLNGTPFAIKSTGQFLSSSSGTSCASDNAAYVRVVSKVTWGPNAEQGGTRPPVIEQSIITPPLGGTLLTKIVDETGQGVPDATVTATGPDSFSANTDATGCAVFAGVALGDYTVVGSKPGYVDPDGASTVQGTTTATASDTAQPQGLKPLGRAGQITATFTTTVSGTECAAGCTGQYAPAMGWSGSGSSYGMANPVYKVLATPATSIATPTPFNLFPFNKGSSGGYTNNYALWAGKCATDQPPLANLSFATFNPDVGAAATASVQLPALRITVTAGPNLSTQTRVKPANILLTDTACGQSWRPLIHVDAALATRTLGALAFPGQPYAPSSKPYTVCADYGGYRTSTTMSNADFVNGTSKTLAIVNGTGGDRNLC